MDAGALYPALAQLTASEEKEMEKFNRRVRGARRRARREDFLNGKPLKSKH